jgi:hypothetical protein
MAEEKKKTTSKPRSKKAPKVDGGLIKLKALFNLREGASLDSEIVDKLPKGSELSFSEIKDGFAKVDGGFVMIVDEFMEVINDN